MVFVLSPLQVYFGCVYLIREINFGACCNTAWNTMSILCAVTAQLPEHQLHNLHLSRAAAHPVLIPSSYIFGMPSRHIITALLLGSLTSLALGAYQCAACIYTPPTLDRQAAVDLTFVNFRRSNPPI